MSNEPVMRLVAWLKERKPEITEVSLDEDLLKGGLLDSLQFVNFLLVIEQLRGNPIPPDLVVPANFTTLRTIHDTFLR